MARILLVDDERDVLTLVKFMLEKDGHVVVAASNGAEALAKAGVEPRDETAVTPDLMILDVMMPVMDGYALCARLQEDTRLRAVPVIVLTGNCEGDGQFDRGCRVSSHLGKPFEPKDLRELIAGLLEKR